MCITIKYLINKKLNFHFKLNGNLIITTSTSLKRLQERARKRQQNPANKIRVRSFSRNYKIHSPLSFTSLLSHVFAIFNRAVESRGRKLNVYYVQLTQRVERERLKVKRIVEKGKKLERKKLIRKIARKKKNKRKEARKHEKCR